MKTAFPASAAEWGENVQLGLSAFATPGFAQTLANLPPNYPLQVMEWTVDQFNFRPLPATEQAWVNSFADQGRLIGHGVNYSLLSATHAAENHKWLERLKTDPWLHRYDRLSVHFGFSTGWRMRQGAPLPVPLNTLTLECGHRWLDQLAEVVPCRIGIENLALAFSRREVEQQGEFLEKLLAPCNGYLLLDLHNLYCQSVNFGIDLMDLVKACPLERVEEIHISGGSWSEHQGRTLRRDTHDDRVPDEIFSALTAVIALCPHLKYIILEQLPNALTTAAQQTAYQQDYARLWDTLRSQQQAA